jgi:hypothetical protein
MGAHFDSARDGNRTDTEATVFDGVNYKILTVN